VENYAGMWLSIITADEPNMKLYADRLFVCGSDDSIDKIKYHRLLSSMISARSWGAITNKQGIATTRSEIELKNVQEKATKSNFLQGILSILAKCPRDLLFVFKINDLLRSINQNLENSNETFEKRLIESIGWKCLSTYTHSWFSLQDIFRYLRTGIYLFGLHYM
jgi:hypothetical protein